MRPPDPIRLLIRVACFLPLLGLLFVLDWISVRPAARRLAARPIEDAVDALIAGRPIYTNADMRDLKSVWIERMPARTDVLVLGGSRLLSVAQEWFLRRTVFNAAMATADLADMVAYFQLCLDRGNTPQLVLLDLNPSLTHEGKASFAPVLAFHLRRALLRYGVLPPRYFAGLFEADGLRWDLRTYRQPPRWASSMELRDDTYCVRPDGTADWNATVANRSPDEVEAAVFAGVDHLDVNFEHWRTTSQPDWLDLRLLRAFLDDLQSRGIRVVVVLAPLHPVAYRYYYSRGGYREDWIRREMASRGIPVIGSYDPAIAHATRADFYDDVHPHGSLIHRLLIEAGIL